MRRIPLVGRFIRQEDGAAAVEFGMIALPFLTIIFMIVETAIVFFAQQALETAVANSARLVMTGQAQSAGLNQTSFKTAVCADIIALFDCTNKLYIDIQTYASFGTIDPSVKLDASGNPITGYAPGKGGDIVVVRFLYPWPIIVPLVRNFLADSTSSTTRLLVATTAFRNEPY